MSQRQEIEGRLALFDDLSGILGAMRGFALAELRRVSKREAAQQQVVEALAKALDDVAAGFSNQVSNKVATTKDIWLLFGSVRGFCGSFNEDVLRLWRGLPIERRALILLGERLHDMCEPCEQLVCIAGADGGLDATSAIDRILAAIAQLHGGDDGPFRLWGCFRDESAARSQQLWPLPVSLHTRPDSYPPLSYAPLPEVAAGVAEHYLFHSLLAMLLRSIRVENHMRLMQMETALGHLERGSEDMHRLRNRLRQEEIVEEIELMVGGRKKGSAA